MKKHLFTAALAIVALGGAVASTANHSNTISRSSLVGVYYNPGTGCQLTSCEINNQGTQCSAAPGNFYDLADGTCIPGNEIPAPSGNLPL